MAVKSELNSQLCPVIHSPCQSLPAFAHGQKLAFCDLCQKNVHNFSALHEPERRSLLKSGKEICVRYALVIPTIALLSGNPALAQDSDSDVVEMEPIQVVGGGLRFEQLEPMFLASELDEQLTDEPEPKR